MSFNYNGEGVTPSSGGTSDPVPAGAYRLRIVETKEGKSKAGDPQVTVTFRVVGGQYNNRRIPFHRVTFLPKDSAGAGIALGFLKAIGQPYEGKFAVNPKAWEGKEVLADVLEDEYQGQPQNKIGAVDAVPADGAETVPTVAASNSKKESPLEEIPF